MGTTKGEGRLRDLLSSRDQLGRKAIVCLPGLGCACEVRDRVQPQDICWGLRMGEGCECQEKEKGEGRAVSTSHTEFLSARTLVLDTPLLLECTPIKETRNHTGQHYSPSSCQGQGSPPFVSSSSIHRAKVGTLPNSGAPWGPTPCHAVRAQC